MRGSAVLSPHIAAVAGDGYGVLKEPSTDSTCPQRYLDGDRLGERGLAREWAVVLVASQRGLEPFRRPWIVQAESKMIHEPSPWGLLRSRAYPRSGRPDEFLE